MLFANMAGDDVVTLYQFCALMLAIMAVMMSFLGVYNTAIETKCKPGIAVICLMFSYGVAVGFVHDLISKSMSRDNVKRNIVVIGMAAIALIAGLSSISDQCARPIYTFTMLTMCMWFMGGVANTFWLIRGEFPDDVAGYRVMPASDQV